MHRARCGAVTGCSGTWAAASTGSPAGSRRCSSAHDRPAVRVDVARARGRRPPRAAPSSPKPSTRLSSEARRPPPATARRRARRGWCRGPGRPPGRGRARPGSANAGGARTTSNRLPAARAVTEIRAKSTSGAGLGGQRDRLRVGGGQAVVGEGPGLVGRRCGEQPAPGGGPAARGRRPPSPPACTPRGSPGADLPGQLRVVQPATARRARRRVPCGRRLRPAAARVSWSRPSPCPPRPERLRARRRPSSPERLSAQASQSR